MTRQYSPKTFFRQTPNTVLKLYFEARGLALNIDWKALTPRRIEPLFDAIESLPDEVRDGVERDFGQVFDMANPRGRLLFVEQGEVLSVKLADRLADVENHYEAALIVLLDHREVFEMASNVHEMYRLGHWRNRWVGKRLHATAESEQIVAFENAMRRIYKKQGRGRNCHVDPYQRRDPLRFCYFAYPEDYPTSDIEYDADHNFKHVMRRPALENVFVYDPETGVVNISSTGSKGHKEALAEAFCKHILGLKALPPDNGQAKYDLMPVVDPAFTFPIEPGDNVERIDVKTIRLDYPDADQTRVTVNVKPNGSLNTIHNSMRRALNLSSYPLDRLHPSRAEIAIEFKPVNGKRGKRLSFPVTHPDGCGLKDDPHDQVARRILRRAKIAND